MPTVAAVWTITDGSVCGSTRARFGLRHDGMFFGGRHFTKMGFLPFARIIAKSSSMGRSARADLKNARDPAMRARRSLVVASMVGMLAMTPVVLLQTGIVRHLPDPPWPGFDSDRVNRSWDAFRFGVPDGALALAGFALNLPLAGAGGRRRPGWLAILTMAKTAGEAAAAAWYFSLMPLKQKRWCAYCIAAAAASAVAFVSTLPEGTRALRRARSRR